MNREEILAFLRTVDLDDDPDWVFDNRDIGETWLTYRRYPGVTFRISVKLALRIVENAIDNVQ